MNISKKDIIFSNVNELNGVGKQLSKYLKKKKIEKVKDILLNLPYSETDRSKINQLDNLEIGKIQTIKVKVLKYYFPRIKNLPNKIICEDKGKKIEIVYFNSREGYLKKILPLNELVVVSGKVSFFKNKYQITNPDYVVPISNEDYVKQVISKYSLTKGVTEKKYRSISDQVINNLPHVEDWFENDLIKRNNLLGWKESIIALHKSKDSQNIKSKSYRRLVFDEICANLLTLSKNRKKIKMVKKKEKSFNLKIFNTIVRKLSYKLTSDQIRVIDQINKDLSSSRKMFRILQGDVGSGKTIVALLAIANVVQSGFQSAFMAPTEILAKQHYESAKSIYQDLNFNIEFLTGKTDYKKKKEIINKLKLGKIDIIFGTHSLFQKKIFFKNLGFIIIDEQHKFGVKQRLDLAQKGGSNCDVLLMSATPIPRTLMMSMYGDMDISIISKKPSNRKKIITLSKPEKKIHEIWPYIKKKIINKEQVFWVCPLIEESKILDFASAKKKYDIINNIFPGKVGLIHGALDKKEKENVLLKFLKKKIFVLVSTTVIEVGIDFPNANTIIIENANKFGLSQLHQLRGRVGRGKNQGVCFLLFKDNPSKNAIKRIKILKESDNGFFISEKDMLLRGFGDIVGYQQSGLKNFKFADPVIHEDLFIEAEKFLKKNEENVNSEKYNFLLKLFDRAEIINQEIN